MIYSVPSHYSCKFGNNAGRQILRKSNPFNGETRADLVKYLLSDEFRPLQQVVTVLIVASTRKVIFEPAFAIGRFVKE
jgi:hypothetical protein